MLVNLNEIFIFKAILSKINDNIVYQIWDPKQTVGQRDLLFLRDLTLNRSLISKHFYSTAKFYFCRSDSSASERQHFLYTSGIYIFLLSYSSRRQSDAKKYHPLLLHNQRTNFIAANYEKSKGIWLISMRQINVDTIHRRYKRI